MRGRLPRRTRWLACLLAVALAVAPLPAARAQSTEPLSAPEAARLGHGETIERTQDVDRDRKHYVGGVTYTIVEATPSELETIFYDVSAYQTILPHTLSARLFARIDDDLFVEVRQGNALVQGSYTIRLRRSADHREVRFWLDRERPHDIEDAWGFFRIEPLASLTPGVPRTLVTYGILLDIGPGIVRALFESKIRDAMLSVPQRLRSYVWKYVRPARPQPVATRALP
jgi:hypothetical protein